MGTLCNLVFIWNKKDGENNSQNEDRIDVK